MSIDCVSAENENVSNPISEKYNGFDEYILIVCKLQNEYLNVRNVTFISVLFQLQNILIS